MISRLYTVLTFKVFKMSLYSDLLKNPLWQKKRLEILSRDNWQCHVCRYDEEMLVVHHKYYDKEKMPWDYDDKAYITLCDTCHREWHKDEKNIHKYIIENLRRSDIDILYFIEISQAFRDLKLRDLEDKTVGAIIHALSDPKAMLVLLQMYEDLSIEKLLQYSLIKQ